MSDYFVPSMHLYIDHLIDWGALLSLGRGEPANVEIEVGTYRAALETCAALAESFGPKARKHALLYGALAVIDVNAARKAALDRGAGSERDQADFERDTARIRLLTPLCKYFAAKICDDPTRDTNQLLRGLGVSTTRLRSSKRPRRVCSATSRTRCCGRS